MMIITVLFEKFAFIMLVLSYDSWSKMFEHRGFPFSMSRALCMSSSFLPLTLDLFVLRKHLSSGTVRSLSFPSPYLLKIWNYMQDEWTNKSHYACNGRNTVIKNAIKIKTVHMRLRIQLQYKCKTNKSKKLGEDRTKYR